jgi:hypothetical protein
MNKVVVLEIDDDMDIVFTMGFLISIFGIVFGGHFFGFWMVVLMVLCMIAIPILKFNYQACYELDTELKSISFVRELAGYRSTKIEACFKDIDSIVTDFRYVNSKHHRSSFEYGIFLLTKSPAFIRVSEWSENSLDRFNTLAEIISKVLECKYVPGKREQKVKALKNDTSGELEVTFEPCERAAGHRAYEDKWHKLGF